MKTITSTRKYTFRQRHVSISNPGVVSRTSLDQVTTWNQSVTKDDTPRNYRSLIRSGLNATTVMSGTSQTEIVSVPGTAELNAVYKPNNPVFGFHSWTSGDLFPVDSSMVSGFNADLSNLATARNQAITRLYQNLAAIDATFKGMVFAGELRETLGMIHKPASALRKGVDDYLRDIRRRIPTGAGPRRTAQALSGLWLEYAFGWKPLVSDIDSAVDHFFKSRLVRPIFTMVRGTGYSGIVANSGVTGTSVGLPTFANIQRTDRYIVKYYGIYSSRGNGSDDRHTYGWNPSEFIPTLWELIPYSFLIDYFTNLGDIVTSWSYRFIGLNFLSLTQIQMVEAKAVNCRIVENVDTSDWDYRYRGDLGSGLARRKSFTRSPSVELPVPSFELQCPGLNSAKWLNMGALATQLALSRRHVSSR